MKILQSDEVQRSFNGENLPLFIYSYSSRGIPEMVERLKDSLPHVPNYLLSLYDFEYILPPKVNYSLDSFILIGFPNR